MTQSADNLNVDMHARLMLYACILVVLITFTFYRKLSPCVPRM
jgi:hypothetical protein